MSMRQALDFLNRQSFSLRSENEIWRRLTRLVEEAATWDGNKDEWMARTKLLLWVLGMSGSGPDDIARVLWDKANEESV